jgi:hypothetical protein
MSAGLVTGYLRNLIARQVEDRRLVVWYDPEQAGAGTAGECHETDLAWKSGPG